MSKDRNIAPYPIYPPYQGMGFMPMPNMINPNFMSNNTCPYQNESQMNNLMTSQANNLSTIEQQVMNLEKRVSTLENMINNSNSINNNYNSSNYQML